MGLIGSAAFAQKASVTTLATTTTMPAKVDSNSPAFWLNSVFHLINSTVTGPMISSGAKQNAVSNPAPAQMNALQKWPFWIESVWTDPSGVLFAWYHQEIGPCGGTNYLAVPHIGAAISYDSGKTFLDLGTILADGDAPNCKSKNGFVAGGNGDFSVILDRTNTYFYFLYTNYGGPAANQGVAIARMPYESRFNPGGMVKKYYNGGWNEPGIQGQETPVFSRQGRLAGSGHQFLLGPFCPLEHLSFYLRGSDESFLLRPQISAGRNLCYLQL